MSTLELVHRFTFREPFHRGPLVAMSRGKWARFDQTVYERSYESLQSLKLISSDLHRYLESVVETAPLARGRHLPDVIDLVTDDNLGARVIMRLPPGELLQDVLKTHRSLPIDDVLSIVRGVAEALIVCRASGSAHRGPTADRVWLGRDGEVILLGHGEVMYSEVTFSLRVMVASQLVWHLPPEVFQLSQGSEVGSSSVARRARLRSQSNRGPEDDPRAEVYALACLTYQCLKSHHPFFLDLGNTGDGIERTLRDAPLEIPSLPQNHPLWQLLLRSMSRQPAERPATVSDFLHEFEEALNAESSDLSDLDAGPSWVDEVDEEGATSETDEPRPDTGPLVTVRTWPWIVSTITLAVTLMIAVTLYVTRPTTIVITSDPPELELQEVIGHTATSLGRTPILLPRQRMTDPLVLQLVGLDGVVGEPVVHHPVEFTDLGRCRSLRVEARFPDP